MSSKKPLKLIIVFLVFSTAFACAVIPRTSADDADKEEESLFVARKAFEDGFYEVSLGLLERFLKNYPGSKKAAEVRLLIGQCYFQQNKFFEALTKFEELLNSSDARDIKDAVTYWVAEVHFRGNNFLKATAYYKRIIDEFPNSKYAPAAYYSLGWCLFQEKSFKEAYVYFKAVEEKYPKESFVQDANFKIIECLYNIKDYALLKENIKKYLKAYSKDQAKLAYLYYYMAEADYYLDNFNGAVESYNKVLSFTSDEKVKALSRLGIGWSYLKLRRYDEAKNMFTVVKLDDLESSSKDILLLGKAILASEQKDFKEAGSLYDKLLKLTQDPAVMMQAYLGKAESMYNSGQFSDSAKIYREALNKVTPSLPSELVDKLHYGLAWACLKEGEFKGAIEEFQKVAKQSEDKIIKVSAMCQIGDAYQNEGEYEQAIRTYDSILKEYPDSFYGDYVQYQLGISMLKNSNYNGAILAFQALKSNFPNSKLLDDAAYAMGLSYFQMEDYGLSKDIFEKFQEEYKESYMRPQAMYLLAISLYNLGKYNEAIEAFKNIIRQYGNDSELVQKAEYEIADCYYQLGDEKEAMARFKALRSKYPDSSLTPEVIWWLGEYYYRRNDLSLARRYFSSLIQDFPKSSLVPNAYYILGSIFEAEADYDAAVDSFGKVAELGKSDITGTAAIAMADVYIKQGKLDLALVTYKRVLADYVNLSSLIYPKLADIYSRLGDYNEAIEYYTKSLSAVPVRDMSTIQFKIAELKEAQGKLDDAIEEYTKVSYLYSEDSELSVKSLLRVAQIYEGKENFKEAAKIYEKIISLGVEEAKYAKERIDWIRKNAF